jgi:hypothetical protein
MGRRAKALVLAREAAPPPYLLAAAVLLIMLFTVSLAMAEPQYDAFMLAAHDETTENLMVQGRPLETDAFPGGEPVILSRPLQPPFYHDRYRFYHRYDHARRSHFNPIDDGAR